jgi:methionyl-tRNA formyltransferase
MDLIFLGTPAFAVPTLEKIIAAGHTVLTVITQPDRPKGRGQVLATSPVKDAALRHGLPVFQPERIRRPDIIERLATFKTDAMVVVGYGQIIPQSIIDMPRHGIINVHASLLPKYRGAAPVQWAIANGETVTGVTTMRIDAGLDTGDMLLRAETPIDPDETAVELGARLADLGAGLLVETLASIDSIQPEKQDSSQATLAPILKKEDGVIDWTLHAQIASGDSNPGPGPTLNSAARLCTSGSRDWQTPPQVRPAESGERESPSRYSAVQTLCWRCSKSNRKARSASRRTPSPTASDCRKMRVLES